MALLHEDAHRPEPVGYVVKSAPGRIAINGSAALSPDRERLARFESAPPLVG